MNLLADRLVRRSLERMARELKSHEIEGFRGCKVNPRTNKLLLDVPMRVSLHPGIKVTSTLEFLMECETDPKDFLHPTLILKRNDHTMIKQQVGLLGMKPEDIVSWAGLIEQQALREVAEDVMHCMTGVTTKRVSAYGVVGELAVGKEPVEVDVTIRARPDAQDTNLMTLVAAGKASPKRTLMLNVYIGDDNSETNLEQLSDAWACAKVSLEGLLHGKDRMSEETEELAALEVYLKDTAPAWLPKFTCSQQFGVGDGDRATIPVLVLGLVGGDTQVQVRSTGAEAPFDMELVNMPQRGGVQVIETCGEIAKTIKALTPKLVSAHLSQMRDRELKAPGEESGLETSLELA